MSMSRQYLMTLEQELREVPEPLRQEWLADYVEHFRIGIENGQPEEEICRELGDPRLIARELKLNNRFELVKTSGSLVQLVKAVLVGTSLGLFNLIFVLAPFIAVAAVLLALWAVVAAFFIAALVMAWQGAFGGENSGITGFSLAFIGVGLGIISFVGTRQLTKGFVRGTARYLQANRKLLRDSIRQQA
ncbi:HAAS signaling domain-containing protein [Paenibacillus xylaniclasticus]|uniref:HAAS signaling domain-containing protein n=1 Tax=Paenibacillus xylaniclasticus TaxID=588083 RepID=UPI000FD90F0B|nr:MULTISPECIES: DUF1700 domain-containing protein [Paenibacillus]GFN32839.1 membrane protein [Paenibacillus curdlanolyticus]